LARLSVLAGSFDALAAQRVAEAPRELLARLLRLGLVTAHCPPGNQPGSPQPPAPHYALPPAVRRLTAHRLDQLRGERARAERCHAAHFLGRLAELAPALAGPDGAAAVAELTDALPDLRLAWAGALRDRSAALVGAALPGLLALCERAGLLAEGEQLLHAALAALAAPASAADDGDAAEPAEPTPDRLGARLAVGRARLLLQQGRLAEARSALAALGPGPDELPARRARP
jgi:hypothetical protein